MSIPLWLIATVIYIGLLVYGGRQSSGDWFDISPLLVWMAATIGYLLFWVIYLAIK